MEDIGFLVQTSIDYEEVELFKIISIRNYLLNHNLLQKKTYKARFFNSSPNLLLKEIIMKTFIQYDLNFL